MTPELFGIISVVFAIVAYPPYIISILRRKTVPHAFSWVLWTLLTWIAYAIQASSGAGAGSWATGITALCTTIIMLFTFKYGEKNITRSDRMMFIGGIAAIPLWLLTKDPTASAILVTLIDAAGFYPTMRKSWLKPREEMAFTHFLSMIKHGLSLRALAVVNIPTAFYPAALLAMNVILVAIILIGRSRKVVGPEGLEPAAFGRRYDLFGGFKSGEDDRLGGGPGGT